ncbi:hypothetical protein A0H81_15011 [Grifola frondosa]|uniref:Uncharacterized protein n=1 Tax=Grifola frondosa TaxID=5627 RepID=A0A1C7LJQ9_GRIFR|nr:hypothetical protein A0H81_15011 [Grifola frondosa]
MAPVFSSLKSPIPFELILMIEMHTTHAFWGLSVVDNPWFMIEPFKWEDMLLEFLILDLDDPVRAEKILCHLENFKTRLTAVKQLELHVQANDLLPRILRLFSCFTSLRTLKLQYHNCSHLHHTLRPFLCLLPSLSIQYLILQNPNNTITSAMQFSFMPLVPSIQQVTVYLSQVHFGFYFEHCMPHLQKALPSLRRAYYLTHITNKKDLEDSESYGRVIAERLAESLEVLVYSRLIKTGQSDFVMREGDVDLPDYV